MVEIQETFRSTDQTFVRGEKVRCEGCGKVRQEKEGNNFRQPVPNCLISRGEGEEGGGGGNNDDLDEGKGREEEGGGEDKPCVSNI